MNNDQPSFEELSQKNRDLESENKRLERELQKTKEKVISSEKFKSAFLANMSHAVRTPMNAIIGFSELIGMEGISELKKMEYTKIINEKGHQLLSLIDDIIEISKLESGKLEFNYSLINLDDFLNELFVITLQKKIRLGKESLDLVLEKNSSEEFGSISIDSGRLQQILNNILTFSIQNTNKGMIRFGYNIKDAKIVEFFVIDTGLGLNKDDVKLLFDYFWQFEDITHQRLSGIGLGLTIAKNLIEACGGKMMVTSELNKGTEFFFTLPIDKPGKSRKQEHLTDQFSKDSLRFEPVWKDKVILVVEDDDVNYQFIEALLEKTQVQMLHAENGDQALELCKTINKIDLILMDIKLPEKNGYEITKEIKEFRKDIPIIAQTAFAILEVRDKCLDAGCEDVISKPVEIELFMQKINKYLIEH
jgi:CheY-like chemotaxis protein/nitrogen-specific signal transduction histidine kinase